MLTPRMLSVGPRDDDVRPGDAAGCKARCRSPAAAASRHRRPVAARAGPEHGAPGGRIGGRRHDEVGAAERQRADARAGQRVDLEHDVAGHEPVAVPRLGRGDGNARPATATPACAGDAAAGAPTQAGEAAHAARPPGIAATPASRVSPFPAGPPPGPAPAGPPPLPAAAAPATPVVPPPPVIPPVAPPWLAAPPAPASPSLLLPGWEQATERQAMARRQFNLVMRGGTLAEIDGHRVLATPAWSTRLATQRGVRSGRRARERATFIGTVDERPVGGAQIALPGRAPFESKKAGQRLSR